MIRPLQSYSRIAAQRSAVSRHPEPISDKPATVALTDILEQAPGRYNQRLRDIYLGGRETSKLTRLRSVIQRGCDRYCALAGKLPLDEAQSNLLQKLQQAVQKNEHATAIALAGELRKTSDGTVARIAGRVAAHQNEIFCLEQLPRQSADGLFRPVDYYTPPGALTAMSEKRGWDLHPQSGLPIADVVVIGAGPGGLSTAYQAALRGLRTVTFEGGIAGQAFSDANAQAVHSLRTSADASNLMRTGHSHLTFEHPLSLHGHLAEIRSHAIAGRQKFEQAIGREIQGIPHETLDLEDRNAPAARAEFYEHSAQVTREVATGFDNSFLCERSPVTRVEREADLVTIETARGHKIHARKLVLATGFVGGQGEHARMLPGVDQLAAEHPDHYLVVGDDRQIAADNEALQGDRQLILADRLLGHRAAQQKVMDLPPGSRAAVVGSGESAVKAALELLSLNPELNVDLYTKGTLEAAQTQLSNETLHPAVLETRRLDPQFAEWIGERFERFGTPVTPRSLTDIFEAQQSGRLRLHELGCYFNPDTIEMRPVVEDGRRRTELRVKSDHVEGELERKADLFAEAGLNDPKVATELPTVDLMVSAIGYNSRQLPLTPLAQNLIEVGLARREGNRLVPTDATLKTNSAGNPTSLSDSSIPGLAVAGRQLAEQLVTELPERESQAPEIPRDRGLYWPDSDPEWVDGVLANRGLAPEFAENARRRGGPHEKARLIFPSADDYLRRLQLTPPENLSAAERLTLERGRTLADRMAIDPPAYP